MRVTCRVGDIIMSGGCEMVVTEILDEGSEAGYIMHKGRRTKAANRRSVVQACKIMPDNGQVLRRSPVFVGDNWIHVKKRRKGK